MFEKYIDEQPVVTKTLCNALTNNKLSHAYIFETNGYQKAYELILEFVKHIACPNSTLENHKEEECNICSAINTDNYIELKIINPETLQIKKEEMISLQQEFKNKAIEGNKKIYLIKNAEKLNSSSSNTILKFLEEPEDNIIAILITPSRYALLNTIMSRCQMISFQSGKDSMDVVELIYRNYFSSEVYTDELKAKIEENINVLVKFVESSDSNPKNALIFETDLFLKYFKTREEVLIAFEIIKMIYYDMMKYILNGKIKYFEKNKGFYNRLASKNDINSIALKLNLITKTIEKIKCNVNSNLLLDKYLMEMGGM